MKQVEYKWRRVSKDDYDLFINDRPSGRCWRLPDFDRFAWLSDPTAASLDAADMLVIVGKLTELNGRI